MKYIVLFFSLFASASAFADCTVKNDTKYDFTVSYGNVSNHSFGANHLERFPKGNISGQSREGKSFSGTCSGNDSIVVEEKGGSIVFKKR